MINDIKRQTDTSVFNCTDSTHFFLTSFILEALKAGVRMLLTLFQRSFFNISKQSLMGLLMKRKFFTKSEQTTHTHYDFNYPGSHEKTQVSITPFCWGNCWSPWPSLVSACRGRPPPPLVCGPNSSWKVSSRIKSTKLKLLCWWASRKIKLFLCLPANFTMCLYEITEGVKKALERRFTMTEYQSRITEQKFWKKWWMWTRSFFFILPGETWRGCQRKVMASGVLCHVGTVLRMDTPST